MQRSVGHRWHPINTVLQRGDRRFDGIVTASGVFKWGRKTAEAVRSREIVDNHLAEARCLIKIGK